MRPIALIPLDERPVNTRYPRMLAAIAGQTLCLPPEPILGHLRKPADFDALAAWARAQAGECAAFVASCDFVAYGNLINSRIAHSDAADALSRLRILSEINRTCPVHAFSVITRVPNANDAVEEPEYWAEWGTRLSEFSQRFGSTKPDTAGVPVPEPIRNDWLTRRLRNHTVNLALIEMAARGEIDSLLLTSDDTAPDGLPSRERDWLAYWRTLIGDALKTKVKMHPGADEVGSALIAQTINAMREKMPQVWVAYDIRGGEEIVAPYEDRPLRETVAGQIAACGCTLANSEDDADFVLGIATPSPRRADYRSEFYLSDRAEREPAYREFIAQLAQLQDSGREVALADVAYPNGVDPLLMDCLLDNGSPLTLNRLCAFGAWNTAGNTLGTVIAQAACAQGIGPADQNRQTAQNRFLAHRFLEDWGYQSVVRAAARAECERLYGSREPLPADADQQRRICLFIEEKLTVCLNRLQAVGIGIGMKLSGPVRLPWGRTFEVDFEFANTTASI